VASHVSPVQLSGVRETMLWTLYNRASEARTCTVCPDAPGPADVLRTGVTSTQVNSPVRSPLLA
jgi:hypothetical protein